MQLECDRLGASDCDAPEVNAAAVLLMKYVLALEVGWGGCLWRRNHTCVHHTYVSPPTNVPACVNQRQFSCATLTLGTVGAVCDYIGRKPAMIMTTLGQVRLAGSMRARFRKRR